MASKWKCKYCGSYEPKDTMIDIPAGKFCNYDHAAKYGNKLNEKKKIKDAAKAKKAERANTRVAKDKLKTRADWLREAQKEFNRYIRLRDHHEPCISCGKPHAGQYHAGHYKSVGACPELRFNELNCHKQCSPCNNHLSGNIIEYRKNLLLKIGDKAVDWIEGPHDPLKLTIDEIKEIKIKYRKMANDLDKNIKSLC